MMAAMFSGNGELATNSTADAAHWNDIAARLQKLWLDFDSEAASRAAAFSEPGKWMADWSRALPFGDADTQKQAWEEGLSLWETVLGQYGIGPKASDTGTAIPEFPRSDRRFADDKWRAHPFFAVVHQTYLMLSERLDAMADNVDACDPARKEQVRFATRALADALSPSNFPLTNPQAWDKAIETKGESLVKGMEHLIADLKRGQLTHTDPNAFTLGENIAVTPGKVVHRTPMYELIQYSPATEKVMETPIVIFPPWINRFYILDLNPKKSFVKWATEQGLTVFMVSWKSADSSMADVVWDDYIAAQIDAIDHVRERLKVPSTHVIGYCVAGTTLAATLAILARRGEAGKVASATFFTAQVDFEEAGELKHFTDDQQIEAIRKLAKDGYVDGRYLAATFNLLRGNDLIWSYVVKNYLMGEDYPAFDLLHWNGDPTNLPARWHCDYLRDLYRDNRLVVPDSMSALGTKIDLRKIETPAYIQAGREDHIAPPESVWKMTKYLPGEKIFVLAGSGHIAGVVNPPASGKYQYWLNDAEVASLDEFIAGAKETPGSWWTHWIEWVRAQAPAEVAAKGKRKPGGKNDEILCDAPGEYVRTR
jgi:polyhydroxyalkanoate synthase